MLVTATFDHLIDDYTDTLAQHTFFTKQDLCNKDADDTPIAEPEATSSSSTTPPLAAA